jgi:hypothetical protein
MAAKKKPKKSKKTQKHLSTEQRKRLAKKGKSKEFAIPSKAPGHGSYPIPDLAHARNALARAAQQNDPALEAKVRRAVYRKFPELKKKAEARKKRGKK